jgi:hypothetical protein
MCFCYIISLTICPLLGVHSSARNLKAAGLTLLVASSLLLTEGCATSQRNTSKQPYTMHLATNSVGQVYIAEQGRRQTLSPKKERGKILRFFDDFFSGGGLYFFTGFWHF